LGKKIFCLIFSLAIVLICNFSYAEDEAYSFDIVYTGDIIAGEEKTGIVILQATEGAVYTNVIIKVDFISGPANPTIIAYDSGGIGYNIVEIGHWGPETGFAVGGTFKNETPVYATFPEAGNYVVQLTLLDLNNANAVITTKQFTQVVLPAASTDDSNSGIGDSIVDNTVEGNNIVEEIPQTGISIWVYISLLVMIFAIVYMIFGLRKR